MIRRAVARKYIPPEFQVVPALLYELIWYVQVTDDRIWIENRRRLSIAEILSDLPENSSVFLLGRYRFEVQMLDGNGAFSYGFQLEKKTTAVRYSERKDLDITFMTEHGSNGLQADYVFILNNKRRGMGFPRQIADASIPDLLLDDSGGYPFAEERRLFYVALTGAKKKVFLVTWKGNESVFISELNRGFGPRLLDKRYVCPLCGGSFGEKERKIWRVSRMLELQKPRVPVSKGYAGNRRDWKAEFRPEVLRA